MSTTLSVAGAVSQFPELGLDDLRIEPAFSGPGIYRFCREGISTRFTEVTVGADSFDVRMFSMASPEDVALAMQILSSLGPSEVDAENLGVVPLAEAVGYHDAAWAEDQARSGVNVLRALINDGRGPIELPGPRRSYCVGPRVLGELGADDTHLRMLDAIRAVQWLPVRTAGTFVAKRDDKDVTLAVWLGDEVVFPAVKLAALSLVDSKEVVVIDAARVPELAGDRWRYIDERQGHVQDFGDAWPAVVAAARAFVIEKP